MSLEQFSPGLVFLLMAAGLFILMVQNFRLALAALAAQYLLVFLLVTSVLPSSLALVKLVVGWMITALFISEVRLIGKEWENRIALSGNLLRGGILLFLWVVVYLALPLIQTWIPVDRTVLLGGMILISCGLIQVGLSNQVLRISIGLLTLFSGFEVVYAALEPSVLVSGLLVLVNIGIGLAALFLVIRGTEGNEVII